MRNLRMKEKIENFEAIDIQDSKRTQEGDYILPVFIEDIDYCDSKEEVWIWSIGKNYETGQILASTSNKFYQNPDYECLFLR